MREGGECVRARRAAHGRSVAMRRRDNTLVAVYGSALLISLCIVLIAFSVPDVSSKAYMAYALVLGAVFLVCLIFSDALCMTKALASSRIVQFGVIGLTVLCACGLGVVISRVIIGVESPLFGLSMAMGCAAVNCSMLMCCLKEPHLCGAVSMIWMSTLIVFLVSSVVFFFDLPVTVAAASMVALGAYGIQLMPNLVVHVPDRYLVQWQEYMTQRWTVRGVIPENARALSLSDVDKDMPRFLARYDAGVTMCGICTLLGYVMLMRSIDNSSLLVRIGTIALSVALIVFLELKPRQSGRIFERLMMRFLGLAVMTMALLHIDVMVPAVHGVNLLWPMLTCVVVGLVMVVAVLAQHGGFYSLLLSRIGDGLCTLSVLVLLPAAFFAAGGFELLRGGML